MIDMSRSMFYNGYFPAAKRVALALDSLIRSKYPRDNSASSASRTGAGAQAERLAAIDWNEYEYGTNMQHGSSWRGRCSARQRATNRQIIIITDGEPTAHFETDESVLQLPADSAHDPGDAARGDPLHARGITINTFMLERSPYLMKFVNDLMKINSGRVFFATPDRLGEYILVDYVENKRKFVA